VKETSGIKGHDRPVVEAVTEFKADASA